MKKDTKKGTISTFKKVLYALIVFVILFITCFFIYENYFAPTYLQNNVCVAFPGIYCAAPLRYANGTISFNFAQHFASIIYNVQFGCSLDTIANYSGERDAKINFFQYDNHSILDNGAILNVSNLQCYSFKAKKLGSSPYGTEYQGILWLKYTSTKANNTYITVNVAYLSVNST